MKINLSIPDDLFEQYVKQHGLPGTYSRMREAIDAYKDVKPSDRVVLLGGDVRRAIEAVFQTTLDSPEKLLKLIQNMNSVKIGDVQMEFSSDQLERLKAQAGFHGRTLEQYIKETVAELKESMLERV